MQIKRYCPNGCMELSASGPDKEYIREEVLENYQPEKCPLCGSELKEEVSG